MIKNVIETGGAGFIASNAIIYNIFTTSNVVEHN
jgi:hypothetical protein